MPIRKIDRSPFEPARDVARAISKTAEYQQSRKDRRKVEMLFAHLKRILFYNLGGGGAPGKSEVLSTLGLDPDEKRALVAFLRSLDGASLLTLSSNSRRQTLP